MNPFSRFKQYIAGEAIANARDEFERASINLLMNYGIIGTILTSFFTFFLFVQGFKIVAIMNTVAILLLQGLFVLIKKTHDVKKAAVLYVIIQQIAATGWGITNNFSTSPEQLFWLLLNVLIAFFILGNRWGFLISAFAFVHVAFGTINEISDYSYFHVPEGLTPRRDFVSIIVPFILDVFVLREFVRTRGVAEQEIKQAKDKNEDLLHNILPTEVAEELKTKGKAEAKLYENVTVLYTDFRDFTKVSEKLSPQQLVNELHESFKGFDEIIGKYNIEKIKTVGDAYLAVCGLPVSNPNHATEMVKSAIEIKEFMKERKKQNPDSFEVRIGIHSGRVVAGIVGVKKFAYDIWGDAVNTAARMEQNGEAGKVNISEATYELVKHKFGCEYRGEIEAKNKGKLKMYFVE